MDMRRWRSPLPWALAGLGLAAVALGITAHHLQLRLTRERVADYLQANLDGNVVAVRTWCDDRLQLCTLAAQSPALREAVAGILAGRPAPRALAELTREAAALDVVEVLVTDAQGRMLAGHGPEQLPDGFLPAVRRAVAGTPALAPPTLIADGRARLAMAAPVLATPGQTVALVMTFDPAGEFSRILETGRIGRTGETYAVDSNGRMVSQSRFRDQLVADGLLAANHASTVHTVAVSEPGGGLTSAAAGIVAGNDGSDLDGYRCYRGAMVVGAWRWLPELGVGVVSELGATEAWAPLRVLRGLTFGMLALAALAGGAFVISDAARRAAQRRALTAERDAKMYGQYRLIRRIGAGGMGEVHLARHALLRRPTAVKLLRHATAEDILRFEREVQVCSRLTHPNTVTIYDYGRTAAGAFYCAMELLDGLDLDELVSRHGPVPPARVVNLLRQVLGSLGEAHAHGIVHRDIKPANLMTCRIGGALDIVKVLDFGLARRVDRPDVTVTSQDLVSGTPPFMAPEIIRQETQVDGRVDLYALACVGWFLLAGRMLFDRPSAMEVLTAHLQEPPEDLRARHPWVPADLAAVIMLNLAKDPRERSADARAMSDALGACACATGWSIADATDWWTRLGPKPHVLIDEEAGIEEFTPARG
jgi:hypothetical protein